MDLLKLCKDLIAINSVTVPQGTKEMVAFLSREFRQMGCRVQIQDLEIDGFANQNLFASIGPENSENSLLFNTHLDTVSPGPHPEKTWTLCHGNPFLATESDGFLHGLGTADTKLAMACICVALHDVLKERSPADFRETLTIMGSAGEEKGLLGAKRALESGLVKAKFVLDSEPSNLQVVWSHKGFCVMKMVVKPLKPKDERTENVLDHDQDAICIGFDGEAAHSSTPDLGKNALTQALRFLELFFDRTSNIGAHDLKPFLLEAGSAANIIPAHADLYLHGLASPGEFIENLQGSHPLVHVNPCKITAHQGSMALPETVFRAAVDLHHEISQIAEDMKGRIHADFSPATATSALTLCYPENVAGLPQITLFQDHRFIHPESGNQFFFKLSEAAKRLNARHPLVEIQVELERLNLPMVGDKHSPFVGKIVELLKGTGFSGNLITKSGCTEGALFASHGMEAIVIGPGQAENNIHKPNEKVKVSELYQAVQFYKKTIERFCL